MAIESTILRDGRRGDSPPAARALGAERHERRLEALASGAVVLSFATLIALLDSSQLYLKMIDHGHSWARIFSWQLLIWWSWAAMTPAIPWMVRRFGIDRCGRTRFAAVHLGGALAFALVHALPVTFLTIAIDPFAPMSTEREFGSSYLPVLLSWLPVEVTLYWALLAAWSAFDYRKRMRERELRASQLEARLSAASLEALKLQLHPHFLFNSLNAVAALVRKNQNDAAVRTLSGLGELLRYVLDSDGSQTVELRTELRFVERYLEIQRWRFSDRLEYSVDMPAETAAIAVPSLILQPIVENALEHGIARATGPGLVRVEAAVDGDRLVLSVSDTGPGPGRIERWGIGFANTDARLRELYRDRYELRIDTGERGGTVVTLAFPAERFEEAP